jgi:hypothetical protein
MKKRLVALCIAAATPALNAQPCRPHWSTAIGNPGIAGVVNHLLVWDDGTGQALYASGHFNSAGNTPAFSVAKWDGLQWSRLGTGLTRQGQATRVPGLAIFDDGSGEALYATGSFDTAGGVPAFGVAKWDGSTWSAVGSALTGQGFKMAVYDDGHGKELYLGGNFTIGATIVNITRWNGTAWQNIGVADQSVNTLVVHDDGSGPALFIGGNIRSVAGVPVSGVAKFQNGTWSSPGTGVSGGLGRVNALVPYNNGFGTKLYAGGDFLFAGPVPATNIAVWNGFGWQDIPEGGPDKPITAMATYNDGTGTGLYIGGKFQTVGVRGALSIARYDRRGWSPLDAGLNSTGIISVTAMTVFNQEPGGISLVVGGGFETAGNLSTENIAIWGGCVECYADCDKSTGFGVLDIFDFLCFQSAFVNNDPYACGCAIEPWSCDIFDFLCFQSAFVAGCQ